MYYIDTNICIYFLKNEYEGVSKKWLSLSPVDIKIPSIVKAELLLAVYKSGRSKKSLSKMESFLEPYEIVPFSDEASYEYAEIRADLEKRQKLIGSNDLMIAAIAKADNAILVTNNVQEFGRVKGLKIENWVE